MVCAADLAAAGDFVGDDFVGDFAGIFSAMSRTGAAAVRFTGVLRVDFDDAAAAGLAVFALDFGDAPFAMEVYLLTDGKNKPK